MHGGTNPGAPCGRSNGNYVSGRFTKASVAERANIRALIREWREKLKGLAA